MAYRAIYWVYAMFKHKGGGGFFLFLQKLDWQRNPIQSKSHAYVYVNTTQGQDNSAMLRLLIIQVHIQTLHTHSHQREKCIHPSSCPPLSLSHPHEHIHVFRTLVNGVLCLPCAV